MEQNTRGDSGADRDVHLSADDLAGVVEALTGERVTARPAQTRPAQDKQARFPAAGAGLTRIRA
ncbi:hypothetical protein P3H15_51925 [Rhodococcus sp. T2V]|uniref:hypothetical protein n=1 Tax=Rhodococcus sp. T2V TaxID=3034164 RepID=UPI0023E147D2|nr:hypothetical protein [Rhodococcus sp. T2V]MDF3313422.1 hypothetical protein [Rhodococcus sp. T2V]